MKWFFFALLTLNLLFFGWQSLRSGNSEGTVIPAIPPGTATLKLLSEARDQPPPTTAGACALLGPFADAGAAAPVVTRLTALGYVAQPRPDALGYRVLLPPDAGATLQQLAQTGFPNARLLRTEEPAGTILLDTHPERAAADAKAASLRASGYAAYVDERPQYWLTLSAPAGQTPTPALLNELNADADVTLHIAACP